jgi:hypothetical protein
MFKKKEAFGQLMFFQMKPNWPLRFHVYHIFGEYLNFHSAILAIAKLCLPIYCNETNLLGGGELNLDHIGSCPLKQGSFAPTHYTTLTPSQLSNNQAQHPNQISKTLDIHNYAT